jgi:hypothetical protein
MSTSIASVSVSLFGLDCESTIELLKLSIELLKSSIATFEQLGYWDSCIFDNELQCPGLIEETLGTPSPASCTTLNDTKRLALGKAVLGCDILFTPNVFNLEQLAVSSFERIQTLLHGDTGYPRSSL